MIDFFKGQSTEHDLLSNNVFQFKNDFFPQNSIQRGHNYIWKR